MPGIVGLITGMQRGQAELQLHQMLEAIRHEPFYEAGTWRDVALGVYVGWTAIKNASCALAPLHNERQAISLVVSGEEYAAPGTANRLKARGHSLDLEGPSYLVHTYEEDPNFPAGLNGRFHGLLCDRT